LAPAGRTGSTSWNPRGTVEGVTGESLGRRPESRTPTRGNDKTCSLQDRVGWGAAGRGVVVRQTQTAANYARDVFTTV